MTNPQEALQVIESLRTRNLATMTLEEMISIYPRVKEYTTYVWQARKALEGLIASKMEQQRATRMSVNGTTLLLQVTKDREFDELALERELLPLLSQEQLERVVSYHPHFSWRGMRGLLSIGGRIRELIERHVHERIARVSITVEQGPIQNGATVQPIGAGSSMSNGNGHQETGVQ